MVLVITMSMEQPQYHWYLLIKSYYPNVATYIPDRYDEGYGISFKGIDFADDKASLIIALDCGIKSLDHVARQGTKYRFYHL
jgi:single-stranded DNA-specific DHH superfamily exonuclease